MKFAYADPPYLGCAHLYPEHPESAYLASHAGHKELIERLVTSYPDGWALSASSVSLRELLPLCPQHVRIGSWVKSFCAFKKGVRPCYAWEPVIFYKGRNPPHHRHPPPLKGGKQTTPKDFHVASITLKKGLCGAKPESVCGWILDLLNFQPGDSLDDLFPGTGVMTRVANARQGNYVS